MCKQIFLSIIILLIVNSGCKKHPFNNPDLKKDLQQILHEHLAQYEGKFHGKTVGFGLYIKSAGKSNSRNLYVSSGIPEAYGDTIHFRGASTTKTFTCAAILTLLQQNKLNL